MGQFGIGQSVTRFEDPRLLRGEGRFVEDVNLAGQAYMYLVRSPHAHARIRSIDTSAAKSAPGGPSSTSGTPTWPAPPTTVTSAFSTVVGASAALMFGRTVM